MLYENPFTGDLEFISEDNDYCAVVIGDEEGWFDELS